MPDDTSLPERILDTSLELAELHGWEAVNLYQVADELDISLDDIRTVFPQKDELVEAWFDRADRAVLKDRMSPEFRQLPPRRRVYEVMMRWLQSLQAHRRVTRQMLGYKLEFGHVHLQVLGIMRISRTVQWFREAALLNSTSLCRIIEEICLTGIYLGCFVIWLNDETQDSRTTRGFLKRSLEHVRSLDA